jgi:uridine kinase
VDRFHNPRAVRYQLGPESAEGYYRYSFNYPLVRSRLLDPLGPGGNRRYCPEAFDYRTDAFIEAPYRLASPDSILLFDGIFLRRPELEDCWDVSIFVEIRFETCLERALTRDLDYLGDPETVRARYHQRYFPAQQHYLQTCRPRQRADFVLVNDDPQRPELYPLQALQS